MKGSGIGFRLAIWVVTIAAVAILLPTATGSSGYLQYMIEMVAIYMIATAGLNVAIGFAGQFQMAQGAIMAVAAYGTAILNLEVGWTLGIAIVISVLLAGLLGICVALLSARLGSHYLLLATFGLQIIVIGLIREFAHITGGAYGRSAILSIRLFDLTLTGSTPVYSAFMIVVAGLGLFLSDWIKKSYLGLGMQAARQNERMANASGIYSDRYKFLAVLVSTAYGAVAGVLIGPVQTFLVPDSFGIEITLLLLIIVVVGGSGNVLGVALSTIVLTVASQAAQSATTAWPLIYGLFVMFILTLTGKGLAGLVELATPLLRLLSGRPRHQGFEAIAGRIRRTPTAAAVVPNTTVASAALIATNVRRSFGGIVAVDEVSLEVFPGTVHGLVGPNGSGKTTFFEIVSGFIRYDHGTILTFGKDVSLLRPSARARLGIARSFQHPTVLRESTVFDNVLLGVLANVPFGLRWRLREENKLREWHDRVSVALELVGLATRRSELASVLSYGQRKLLDLARVVVACPSLALLDEPLAGIGAGSAMYVRKVIDFLRSQKCAVLLVEHNMRFVVELCDQLTVLNMGRVIASGQPSEVINHPDVVQSYLGYGSSPMPNAADSSTFRYMSQAASMKFVLES